jgi:PKD repeat protein
LRATELTGPDDRFAHGRGTSVDIKDRIVFGKGWPRRLALLTAVLFAFSLQASPAFADPGDIGYQDSTYNSTTPPSTPTGTKRAENHLWFNDGIWWGVMWDVPTQDYHIYKLNTSTQTWSDTGTLVDPRVTAHQDVLWDGTHLYVASHTFVNDEIAATTGGDSRLYRFSYDPLTKAYSLDAGFPSQINTEKTETLVVDKDSAGKVWATWQQDNQIYVNSTQGSDLTWGTPSALSASLSGGLTVDDNSALVHFGNKIGVMWSNQNAGISGFYFAVHNDGDADNVWQSTETAAVGDRVSDDHISMKSTSDGRVIVAVKTSATDFRLPLTMLMIRDTSGNWSTRNITLASQCPNRPTVLIDEANDALHVLETGPAPPDFVCSTTGGAIYEKTASLSNPAFDDSNSGSLVMLDADSAALHNVTSTKQNVGPATGLAALAINATTKFYWHHYETLPAPPPPGNPPVANFTGTPTTGTAPLAVSFTDTSSNGPTAWSWDFGDGSNASSQNPTHTYSTPGTYTVSLTATNAFGSDTNAKVGYVTVGNPAPVANFTGTPTSGIVPLTVNFTDSSTNGPTAWSWDFGDGGTETAQNPSHTYNSVGTYTVSLTATNNTGSNTLTKVGYITVNPPPPTADFTGTPTGGLAPLTVSFTDASTGNPTSWSWTFGDGGTSTARNPSHTYTAAGNYTVRLTATNAGGSTTKTATIQVTDFTVSSSPTKRQILAGDTTTYTVSVGAVNGFGGTVNLSATGLPSGATGSFSSGSVAGSGSSTLTVTTSSSLKQGNYSFSIRGTSGSVTKTVSVDLQIKKK